MRRAALTLIALAVVALAGFLAGSVRGADAVRGASGDASRQTAVPSAPARGDRVRFAQPVQLEAVSATAAEGRALLERLQNAFHDASAAVLPAVVQVDSTQVVRVRNRFSRGSREVERRGSTGSAVVVRQRARTYTAVTNDQVVSGATTLTITLPDGTELPGRVVRRDANHNLAVVEFETPQALTIATLGDSDRLAVGDWVLAIGSPFGFQSTVTAGIVSAIAEGGPSSGFIQTDAAINPGNSGGPLINLDGQVIGISTWKSGQTSVGGLGFALPVNLVKVLLGPSV